jgi:hypothetical protein
MCVRAAVSIGSELNVRLHACAVFVLVLFEVRTRLLGYVAFCRCFLR